jgi:TonB family protein
MNNLDALLLVPPSGTRRRFLLVAALLPVVLVFSALTAESRTGDKTACPEGETRTEEGCLKRPELVGEAQPVYPKAALHKRVKASVVVSARVTADGRVDDMKVISSSATDNAYRKDFEASALEAFGKWRYLPGTVNGEPRPVYVQVTIEFEAAQSRSWFDRIFSWMT